MSTSDSQKEAHERKREAAMAEMGKWTAEDVEQNTNALRSERIAREDRTNQRKAETAKVMSALPTGKHSDKDYQAYLERMVLDATRVRSQRNLEAAFQKVRDRFERYWQDLCPPDTRMKDDDSSVLVALTDAYNEIYANFPGFVRFPADEQAVLDEAAKVSDA